MSANLEFEIEELVLHGFSNRDRHLIGAAVQQELTRLFAEQSLSSTITHSTEMDHLDGGTFAVNAGTRPMEIGVQIAQAIYTRFNDKDTV